MTLYFISYDLRNNRDYQTLYNELGKFNAIRILESMWCFKKLNTNAGSLRDHFKSFIDSDDGLMVSEVITWAGRGLDGSPNNLP